MQLQMQQRLKTLQEEFNSGQALLSDLETRQSQLRESMLRISGAIQVLQEILDVQTSEPESKIRSLKTSQETSQETLQETSMETTPNEAVKEVV